MTNDNIKNFKLEIKNANLLNQINIDQHTDPNINYGVIEDVLVVVVNHCFTSLFGTKGLLSDIIIRKKRCSQLMR